MPLPTRSDVLTLGYTGFAQPAVYIEAKTLSPSSSTLAYTLQAQPVYGLADGAPPPPPPPPPSGSSGLSKGVGLYAGSSGLYGGSSGLYSGSPGLVN